MLQTDPRSVPACLLLGRLYRERGMAKRARGMFEKVLEIDPRTWSARELATLGRRSGRRPGTLTAPRDLPALSTGRAAAIEA